jgi:hypothetical protein
VGLPSGISAVFTVGEQVAAGAVGAAGLLVVLLVPGDGPFEQPHAGGGVVGAGAGDVEGFDERRDLHGWALPACAAGFPDWWSCDREEFRE